MAACRRSGASGRNAGIAHRIALPVLLAVSAGALAQGNPRTSRFVLPSKVHVAIVEADFSARDFEVLGCGESSGSCLIDSKVPFGVVDEVPRRYVAKLEVSYEGRTYVLDSSDMYDAWNGRALSIGGVRYFGGSCDDERNCRFRGVFSDGAASFAAEWRIVSGRPFRTLLSDSDDIVGLFLEHIDPPQYE